MKIYTKTGDKGETGLFGGKRVSKDAVRIEAYGTIDELNAILGVVRSLRLPKAVEKILTRIQRDLFVIGSELATPMENMSTIPRISPSHITSLEQFIDHFDAKLPKLSSFILPEGTSAAAYLHFARTVCRRAERRVVHLSKSEDAEQTVIIYLNRLSDLLFVLARYANYSAKHKEEAWIGIKRKKAKTLKSQ